MSLHHKDKSEVITFVAHVALALYLNAESHGLKLRFHLIKLLNVSSSSHKVLSHNFGCVLYHSKYSMSVLTQEEVEISPY